MKKFSLLLLMLLVGIGASWAAGTATENLEASTSTTSPEHVYFIHHSNDSYYLDTNTAPTTTSPAKFAFFAGSTDGTYKIYDVTASAWLKCSTITESAQNIVSTTSTESDATEWTVNQTTAYSTGVACYQISVITSSTSYYWNWYLGLSGQTHTSMGVYTKGASSDAGSAWCLETAKEETTLTYNLTDVAGNTYNGTYTGIQGLSTPTFTGVSGYSFTGGSWNDNTYTATITFPFKVSKENGTTNWEYISSMGTAGVGVFYYYVDGINVKVQKATYPTNGNHANYEWAIYPKLTGTAFSFKIKNNTSNDAAYLYTANTADSHDAGTVIVSSTASEFTYDSSKEWVIGTRKLSVNSRNESGVQNVGVWTSSHYGTYNTISDATDFDALMTTLTNAYNLFGTGLGQYTGTTAASTIATAKEVIDGKAYKTATEFNTLTTSLTSAITADGSDYVLNLPADGTFLRIKGSSKGTYVLGGTQNAKYSMGDLSTSGNDELSIFVYDNKTVLNYKTNRRMAVTGGTWAWSDAGASTGSEMTFAASPSSNLSRYTIQMPQGTGNKAYCYLYDNGTACDRGGFDAAITSSANANYINWQLEDVAMDAYTFNITAPEGETKPTPTVTTGKGLIVNGKLYVTAGTEVSASDIQATIDGYATYYDINSTDKTITVTFAQYPTAGYYRLKNVKGDHYLSNVLSGTIKTTSDKNASSVYNVTTMDGGYALQSYETNEYLQNPWHIGTGESYKKAWVLAAGNTTGYFTLYYSEGGHYMTGDGSVTWWTDDATSENAQWVFEPVIIESRSTAANDYGTICLPYDATAEGAIVMECKGLNASRNGVVFDFPEGKTESTSTELKAGVPYLYRATANNQTFATTGTTYTEAGAANNFIGTYTKIENLTAGYYFLDTRDNLIHPTANAKGEDVTYVNVGAYKCYFPSLPTNIVSARSNSVVFGIYGDATTGISTLDTSVDLNKNGKFIQNGRMVIVNNGKKYNAAGQIVK